MSHKARPPGCDSRGPGDTRPAGSESSAIVGQGTDGTEDLDAAGLVIHPLAATAGRCWRCKRPFEGTSAADLEQCTELAHEATA